MLESLRTVSKKDSDRIAKAILKVSDVAMILNSDGVVSKVKQGHEILRDAGIDDWPGTLLADHVDGASRPAVNEMLSAVRRHDTSPACRVVHPAASPPGIPVRYCANRLDGEGNMIVVGRDLRPLVQLESRVIAAQLQIDRGHDREAELESRYRILFQTVAEPIVVVAAGSGEIREVNRLAAQLLGSEPERLAGQTISSLVAAGDRAAVAGLLASAGGDKLPGGLAVRLRAGGVRVRMTGQPFRAQDRVQIMLRLADGAAGAEPAGFTVSRLAEFMRHAPDGVLITDGAGMILWANAAAQRMVDSGTGAGLQGARLTDLLDGFGIDVDAILDTARRDGRLNLPAAILRPRGGDRRLVDVSAMRLTAARPARFGIVLRSVEGDAPAIGDISDRSLPAVAPKDLADIIGQEPLKELVRQSSDLIERACISAALELTGNNRAAAAEALGLSRQGLYMKLRRFRMI